MKRRSGKAARQTAQKQTPVCSASTVSASTSQAASCSSSVTAAAAGGTAAGSGRQRQFTAKRALEMLQNLADTQTVAQMWNHREIKTVRAVCS